MDIEGSWQLGFIRSAKLTNNINLGFWPYPSGDDGLFPPTILDFQAVSSQTDYPEEAYLLAKWMTFGKKVGKLDLIFSKMNMMQQSPLVKFHLILTDFPVGDYPGGLGSRL